MPGSGINTDNALNFKEAGFEMIHFSAISKADAPHKPKGVSFNEGVEGTSDENVIRQMITVFSHNLSNMIRQMITIFFNLNLELISYFS